MHVAEVGNAIPGCCARGVGHPGAVKMSGDVALLGRLGAENARLRGRDRFPPDVAHRGLGIGEQPKYQVMLRSRRLTDAEVGPATPDVALVGTTKRRQPAVAAPGVARCERKNVAPKGRTAAGAWTRDVSWRWLTAHSTLRKMLRRHSVLDAMHCRVWTSARWHDRHNVARDASVAGPRSSGRGDRSLAVSALARGPFSGGRDRTCRGSGTCWGTGTRHGLGWVAAPVSTGRQEEERRMLRENVEPRRCSSNQSSSSGSRVRSGPENVARRRCPGAAFWTRVAPWQWITARGTEHRMLRTPRNLCRTRNTTRGPSRPLAGKLLSGLPLRSRIARTRIYPCWPAGGLGAA
jgi:hypothetical protein